MWLNIFVSQLKDCFGFGRFIGYFCFRDVLSAKHLVSIKGHIRHAIQHIW